MLPLPILTRREDRTDAATDSWGPVQTPPWEQQPIITQEPMPAYQPVYQAAPVFSGRVALVRINTPCQIHQLIAQIWRTRLPKYIVLVANEGYLPGRISFSARSAAGTNVLDFLKSIEDEGDSDIHGHDEAAGGSLPLSRWNRLLAALGFPENVWARA